MKRRITRKRIGAGKMSLLSKLIKLRQQVKPKAGGRRKSRRTMHGGNFFNDLWSGIKDVGKYVGTTILPKVAEVGLPFVAKALMGGRRRKSARKTVRGGGAKRVPRRVIKI